MGKKRDVRYSKDLVELFNLLLDKEFNAIDVFDILQKAFAGENADHNSIAADITKMIRDGKEDYRLTKTFAFDSPEEAGIRELKRSEDAWLYMPLPHKRQGNIG